MRRRERKAMTDMMRELRAEELDKVSGGDVPGAGIALTGISALIIQNATTIIALQPQGGCPAGMICT
jgi:hypothetical protein